jgi:hypothetical protein
MWCNMMELAIDTPGQRMRRGAGRTGRQTAIIRFSEQYSVQLGRQKKKAPSVPFQMLQAAGIWN